SGGDSARMAQSKAPEIQQRYETHTQQAIAAGVFGAPSYVIDGEIFWGQDRLDYLERRLARG
ncbi:MAG: DsbA family protein, partial [Polaromonas sp.]|nr:DsbA family protein [Polaromonas sp.]